MGRLRFIVDISIIRWAYIPTDNYLDVRAPRIGSVVYSPYKPYVIPYITGGTTGMNPDVPKLMWGETHCIFCNNFIGIFKDYNKDIMGT